MYAKHEMRTVFSKIKEVPKPVFFIFAFCLIVPILVFVLGPQQFELVCNFSGGEGETTTESFRLERLGQVRLSQFSYILIPPHIEVYRVGKNQPLCFMGWMATNGRLEPDDILLEPGDYYIIVEANVGSSWTIVVEEEKD